MPFLHCAHHRCANEADIVWLTALCSHRVKVYFVTNRHMSAMSQLTVVQLMANTSPTLHQHFTISRP